MSPQFVLEIEWDWPTMPRYVGPFESKEEAQQFARLNVTDGAWLVIPLARPYRKGSGDE